MKKPPLFVMMSLPGTGKGTQGIKLAEQLNAHYVAAGDAVREVYAEGPVDQFHKQLIERYDKGIIQTDETLKTIFEMMIGRISKDKIKNGLVLDSYPLSMGQISGMNDLIGKFGFDQPIVIYLEVSDGEIVRRLSDRKICTQCKRMVSSSAPNFDIDKCNECGGKLVKRPDDKEEVVRVRIQQYKDRLQPMLDYFEEKGQLVKVNGEQSVEGVFAELWDKVRLRM